MLAYYINLESRPDRRAFMEAQFTELGMNVARLQATTPETIEAEDLAPLTLGEARRELSSTEIAISVSHFRAWKLMLKEGRNRVLVLEDDLRLSPLLPSFIAAIENEDIDVGVIRLETQLTSVTLHRRAEPAPAGLSFHLPLSFEGGAGAYVMSADCAKRILASPKRFILPLDDILFSLKSPVRAASRLRVVVPALALYQFDASPQFDVPSDILVSDAHEARLKRDFERRTNSPKPGVLQKVIREIRRIRYQLAWLPARLFAIRKIVPFADQGKQTTAPRSAAPPRG